MTRYRSKKGPDVTATDVVVVENDVDDVENDVDDDEGIKELSLIRLNLIKAQ